MSIFASPAVKAILSIIAAGLAFAPGLPPYAVAIGGAMLGWLHVEKPKAAP